MLVNFVLLFQLMTFHSGRVDILRWDAMQSIFDCFVCEWVFKYPQFVLFIPLKGFSFFTLVTRSRSLTLEALQSAVYKKFKSLNHVPIWKEERPESIRGDNELRIYRIYPVGLTQRQALYTFKFEDDAELRSHIENNPCAKFEVIFV